MDNTNKKSSKNNLNQNANGNVEFADEMTTETDSVKGTKKSGNSATNCK